MSVFVCLKRVPALKLESKQTSGNLYRMVPPSQKSWFITLIKYSYIYHKPDLSQL